MERVNIKTFISKNSLIEIQRTMVCDYGMGRLLFSSDIK